MSASSFQTNALRAVAHPTRASIIVALAVGPNRFSRIMEFCGLDPGHDTGPFSHHLSSLIESGIVQRQGEEYSLTGFGSKIAELLKAIRKEAEYQLRDITANKGGENLVGTHGVAVRWARPEEIKSGRYGIKVLETDKEMPDAQRAWSLTPHKLNKYNKWVESLPSVKGRRMLVADREGKPAGSLMFRPMVEIRSMPEGGEIRRTVMADVGDVVVLEHGKARGEVAKALLRALVDEGRANYLQKTRIRKINSEDEAVVQTLQELGFERTGTYYEMVKEE